MIDADLAARWEAAGRPGIATPTELIDVLTDRYRAYPIPLEVYGEAMYANDDQLSRGTVTTLMTITHPDVLGSLFTENDTALQAIEAEAVDEYARSLFLGYPRGADDPVSGDFLNMEHALGRRVSVAIAIADGRVSGYRLLGQSERLAQVLRAYAPVSVSPAVRLGEDLDTEEFAAHLRDLEAASRI